MTPTDAARLQDVYRREGVSLLRYARSAAPHAAGPARKLREDLFRAADEAAAARDVLGAVLEANRIAVPQSYAFPAVFTDLNCVAVRYLLSKVVADRAAAVTALETDLSALSDPSPRAALQPLLDLARRHRDRLVG
ncbi:hypothetical protein [Urbifossiella limnaea]|uniref:Uncharacterized protein n=1 Tax=Urbifossiella limnaea TaxID=2528023 RepID=A0A517XVX6_9BACT|nr:hypothetical protein [Urbifossiella limnaea]QDU21649.1 hypothetical protein ETAA1_36200 [Urbifossiella limnaea]